MKKISLPAIITVALLIVALAAGAVALTVSEIGKKRDLEAREQQYREELTPLVIRRTEIENELRRIEELYLSDAPCGANATILFLDLDTPLYEYIYPILGKNSDHLFGTVCFSPDELPGLVGRITRAHLNEMLADGWSTAIFWDGSTELDAYLTDMEEILTSIGIPMPDTLFFEVYHYVPSCDEILARHGMKYAVHHGEAGNELIDTSVTGEIFHPGVVGWNAYGQQKNYLHAIYESKGCGSYSVSFKPGMNSDAFLDMENVDAVAAFERMCAYIEENAKSGRVTCLGFDEAWQNRRAYDAALNQMDVDLAEAREKMLSEIAEIEQAMLDLRNKYE